MHRHAPSALCLAALTLVAASAAQTSTTTLCDGLATQIRGNLDLASKDGLLSLLSRGDHPFIELATQSDMKFPNGGDSEKAEFARRFREKFDPSDALAEAFNGFLDEENNAAVSSLPRSDLHVIESFGGSANCESFLFFQTAKGRQSRLLPSLPRKGERDGDNLICSGYKDDGYLARVGGTDVFLEFMSGNTANNYEFRVVPLQDSRWTNACTLDADFRATVSR